MNTQYNYSSAKTGPTISYEPSKVTMDKVRTNLRMVKFGVSHINQKWTNLPLSQKIIIGAILAAIVVWFFYYLKGVYTKRKVMGKPFLTGIKKN